jgi:uncharacterized protein YecE (DUF72 family)
MKEASGILLGTSAFTAAGWPCTFYSGMNPVNHLNFYATRFDSVEVDSTFIGHLRTKTTLEGWGLS